VNHFWISIGIGIASFLLTLLTLAYKLGQFNSKVLRLEEKVKSIKSVLFSKDDGSLNYISIPVCKHEQEIFRKEVEMNISLLQQGLVNRLDNVAEKVNTIIKTHENQENTISSVLKSTNQILAHMKKQEEDRD